MKSNDIATFAIQVEKLEDVEEYRVHLTVIGLNNKRDADDTAIWLHDILMKQVVAIRQAEMAGSRKDVH
jgi:hypothetical protein